MNANEWKLIDRFKEPSSWSALAAGLGTIGVIVPSNIVQVISLFGAAVCVALGVLMKESPAQ